MDLVNWKETDVRRSRGSMKIIPNSSNLERVRPSCENLCHVDPTILCINMLVKTDISWCVKVKSPSDYEILPSSTSFNLRDPFVEGCSSFKQFSLTSVERRPLDMTDTSLKILPSSGSGQCFTFTNVEGLFLRDFFNNFLNECGQQRSLEQLQISIIRQLDTRNSRHIRDALLSVEGLSFCKFCELSQTPNILNVNVPNFSRNNRGCEALSSQILTLEASTIKTLPPPRGRVVKTGWKWVDMWDWDLYEKR